MDSSLIILFYIFICFSIIYLIHHIYNYFQNHFTKPIIKDFVHAPKVEYDKISSIINQNRPNGDNKLNGDKLNDISSNNMQDELKQFMQQELDE